MLSGTNVLLHLVHVEIKQEAAHMRVRENQDSNRGFHNSQNGHATAAIGLSFATLSKV